MRFKVPKIPPNLDDFMKLDRNAGWKWTDPTGILTINIHRRKSSGGFRWSAHLITGPIESETNGARAIVQIEPFVRASDTPEACIDDCRRQLKWMNGQ